ncbi:MAG: DUF4157 domain-containing protein [Cyanobacteria bacterium P01_A01_bin.3]
MPARQPTNRTTATQSTFTPPAHTLVSRPFAPKAQADIAPEPTSTLQQSDSQDNLDRAARAGHHLSQLAVHPGGLTQPQTIQAKISIPAAKFGDISQRVEMPEDDELQMKSRQPGSITQRIDMPEDEELQMKSRQAGSITQRVDMPEDEELQMKSSSEEHQQQPNNTGLPDQLKQGVEQLSGTSLDDVDVHFNSSKPSEINAHAYAQGSDIHVAPGQEQHLPHEAWHVAQQKQGRVKPTQQLAGVAINDDPSLEKEADEMGAKALQGKGIAINDDPALEEEADAMAAQATQRKARASNTLQQKHQNRSSILQRAEGVVQRANYPNLDGPVDANNIQETQYGTGDGQVTFPGIDSCIGIVGRSGSTLTGVHMVMVDKAGTFMVEGSGFDETITATAASVVSVLGKPEEIRVFGEASDWKAGIPSFFSVLGGATSKLSYASNAKGDIVVTWDETAGWSS